MSHLLKKITFILLISSLSNPLGAGPIEFSQCQRQPDSPATFGAECAQVDISLDHDTPSAEKISIHVLRIPSISESNKPPIFFIAGGPGQASSDLAKTFRYQFSELLVEHDFIFVDQRGTGKSFPLNCDIGAEEIAHLTLPQVEDWSITRHKACLEEYAAKPSFFLTIDAVRDLDLIRTYLGYQEVYLWGGSYGTRVVLEFVRQNQKALKGVVLDGLAPTEIQLPQFSEHDANVALKKILTRCALDNACNSAFADLENRWKQLLQKRREAPLKVVLKHPRSEQDQLVYIDHMTISNWVRASLYSRELSALLPMALHEATQDNYANLYSMQALGFESIEESISEGMQLSILCAEDRNHPQKNRGEIPRGDLLTILHAGSLDKICELYPKRLIDKSYFDHAKSAVPALFLSGNYDPVTPARWAESVGVNFSKSRHIVVPGGHHIVSSLGCVPDIIASFFEAPETLETIDTHCVDNVKPMDFFIDNAGPKMEMQEQTSEENKSS